MTSSVSDSQSARAVGLRFSDDALYVTLEDGQIVHAPLNWYPRLAHGTPAERNHWHLLGQGTGIHRPDLDEDVSVAGLLSGARSGESRESIARWLAQRLLR